MTEAIALDASVLIAALNPADMHHEAATGILRKSAISGGMVAHAITIAESAVGAAARGRLDQLKGAYARLGIAPAMSDPDEAWRLARLRADTRLPLPDCCVLDVALESDTALATFDSRLAAAARARGVTVIPV